LTDVNNENNQKPRKALRVISPGERLEIKN